MKQLIAFLLISAVILSCSSDELVLQNPIVTAEFTAEFPGESFESPFSDFIGIWKRESLTFDGVPSENISSQQMVIREDSNHSDLIAVGSYKYGTEESNPQTLELLPEENKIILKRGNIIFNCTYTFLDENTFELDDTAEDDPTVVISTWVR